MKHSFTNPSLPLSEEELKLSDDLENVLESYKGDSKRGTIAEILICALTVVILKPPASHDDENIDLIKEWISYTVEEYLDVYLKELQLK